MEGSGSGAVQIITDGSESRRPKNIWIRLRNTAKNIANEQKILPPGVCCLWPVSVLDLYVFLEQRRLWGSVAALTTGEAAVQVSRQLPHQNRIRWIRNLMKLCYVVRRPYWAPNGTRLSARCHPKKKWHSPISSVPFHTALKGLDFQGPTLSHLPSSWMLSASKALRTGPHKS